MCGPRKTNLFVINKIPLGGREGTNDNCCRHMRDCQIGWLWLWWLVSKAVGEGAVGLDFLRNEKKATVKGHQIAASVSLVISSRDLNWRRMSVEIGWFWFIANPWDAGDPFWPRWPQWSPERGMETSETGDTGRGHSINSVWFGMMLKNRSGMQRTCMKRWSEETQVKTNARNTHRRRGKTSIETWDSAEFLMHRRGLVQRQ